MHSFPGSFPLEFISSYFDMSSEDRNEATPELAAETQVEESVAQTLMGPGPGAGQSEETNILSMQHQQHPISQKGQRVVLSGSSRPPVRSLMRVSPLTLSAPCKHWAVKEQDLISLSFLLLNLSAM